MSERILSAHGSGGKLMNDLIEKVIRKILGDSVQLDDAAILDTAGGSIAFTTDTFTVTPLFFPGGDIGKLSINGTVNDLAVMGATPRFISCGMVIEEGLDMDVLTRILHSMRAAADYAGVSIVTGDTKVVPRGNADGIFINTSGIGLLAEAATRQPIAPDDSIIINGSIGDHGIAVMAERNNLSFSRGLHSDCAPLNRLIAAVTRDFAGSIRFMRDPTRGGVASVLNEIVKERRFGARLFEERLPIREEVHGVCELLGLDPLYVANEGKVLLIVAKDAAEEILACMREITEGAAAQIIGAITDAFPGRAYLETSIGGSRILPHLTEEQLPRIC
jgi:hydrogenase expression/formation protein HypE